MTAHPVRTGTASRTLTTLDPTRPVRAWWLPLAAAVIALALWGALPAERLLMLSAERSAVENATAALFLLMSLAIWFQAAQHDRWTRAALSVVFMAFGARELDFHSVWTGGSVLKLSFYLGEAAPHRKAAALIVLLLVTVSVGLLIRRHGRALLAGVRRREALASTVLCFLVTMALCKILDRSVNLMAESFHLHASLSTTSLVRAVEELLELSLPLIGALGLSQQR